MPINYDLMITPEAKQAKALDALRDYAANKHWLKETGGIEINGLTVATDDLSKTMISGARVAAQNDPNFTTQWKGSDGSFVTIDVAAVIGISDAMLAHVSNCFAAEAHVLAGIESGAITTANRSTLLTDHCARPRTYR